MKTNKRAAKSVDRRMESEIRLAKGQGALAAKQDAEALLRRATLTTLLWEDVFYESGDSIAAHIAELVPQVEPEKVVKVVIEAREAQGLRHAPLYIVREMVRHASHRPLVAKTLARIIQRADEIAEFMALYWREGKCPLAKQVKLGLAQAFQKFDEYQLAKYDRANVVRLRDVLFLVHARPADKQAQGACEKVEAISRDNYRRGPVERHDLFRRLATGELATPDTWEVALSAGADKRATWTRLIRERKIGGLAFLRNLRNMKEAGVHADDIRLGFETLARARLLPLDFLAAAKAAPEWSREIEQAMLMSLGKFSKLPGTTVAVIDVSGSMGSRISAKSELTRLEAATALAVMLAEVCERPIFYATAGNDSERRHSTQRLRPRHGFGMVDEIIGASKNLGGGGIFTRQSLEFIRKDLANDSVDRIVVFSDSQDCDHATNRVPAPFGKTNYIIDVGGHTRGVAYNGVWTAEVTGWSQSFLPFIAALEGIALTEIE